MSWITDQHPETTSPAAVSGTIIVNGKRYTEAEWHERCLRMDPARPPQSIYEDQGGLNGPTNDAE